MIIDKEIGVFNCWFETEFNVPETFIVVDRENRKVGLSLFIVKEHPEDSGEKIFVGSVKRSYIPTFSFDDK